MPKQLDLMALREKRIGELIERVRQKSGNFQSPQIVVIGGYALRAYVPFSRYSRDCDFALPREEKWNIDLIRKWFPDLAVEAAAKLGSCGYLRVVQLIGSGKLRFKIALDFMEGEIRGRGGEAMVLDRAFISESVDAGIDIGGKTVKIRVPAYRDYFLLKLLSARPSDIRDIAAMIWKRGMPEPEALFERAETAIREPKLLAEKIKVIIKDVSDARFVDSCERGHDN